PRLQSRVVGQVRGEHLDRDVAPEAGVLRPVDLSHAPRADRGDDLVGSEARSGGKCHGTAWIITRGRVAKRVRPGSVPPSPLAVATKHFGVVGRAMAGERSRPPSLLRASAAALRAIAGQDGAAGRSG